MLRSKQDVAIAHVVKLECNDFLRPLCWRCWVGWEFPYLGRLVRNMFPWLQKSWGGGEPDAEQMRRISSPREKAWLWGWTTTEGASTIQTEAQCWQWLRACHRYMMLFMTSKFNNSKLLMTCATMQLLAMSDSMTRGSRWGKRNHLFVCFFKFISKCPQKKQHASVLSDEKHFLMREWLNLTARRLSQ